MSYRRLLTIIVSVGLALGLLHSPATASSLPQHLSSAIPQQHNPNPGANTNQKAHLVDLLNQHRAQHGLHPVTEDQELNDIAQHWANHLGTTGEFKHQDLHKVSAALGHPAGVSENIASHRTTDGAMDLWKTSPSHNQNMLDPRAAAVGHGIANYEKGRLKNNDIYVQVFRLN